MAKGKHTTTEPAANKSISVELKRGRIAVDGEEAKQIREMKQKGKSYEEIGAHLQRTPQAIENFLTGYTPRANKKASVKELADPLDAIPADERDDYIAFKLSKMRQEHKINVKDSANGEQAIRLFRRANEAKKIYEELMAQLHAL